MMKRFLFLLTAVMLVAVCDAQSWVGYTTTAVNMRFGPSTEYEVITKLPKGTIVFWEVKDVVGDWLLVTDVENDLEGYVAGRYIQKEQKVESTNSASILETAKTSSYNPVLHVKNQCSETITLRINNDRYKIGPYATETLTVPPGIFSYRASSAGLIPAVGTYTTKSNSEYEWKFFIVTRRR